MKLNWKALRAGKGASHRQREQEPPEAQEKAQKGTFFFFFAFIMKTKQMPQEKGP